MKQEEQNYIAGESANLYSHFENQHGGFTKKKKKKKKRGGGEIYQKIQLYNLWANNQNTLHPITKTLAQTCS